MREMRICRGSAIGIAFVAALFSLAVPLSAQEAGATGWSLSQALVALRKPTGFSLISRVWYTVPLYEGRNGILWDSARVELGVHNQVSPAFDDLSAEVFLEPIAFFDLRVRTGIRFAYDAFGFGYAPLGGYGDDYAEPTDLAYETRLGTFFVATPRLKAAFGPLIVLNAFHIAGFDFSGAGESHFYEQVHNVALRTRDAVLQNSTALLYDFALPTGRTLVAGCEFHILSVPRSGERTQRLSALVSHERPLGSSPWRLTAALVTGVYLEQRYYDAEIEDLFVAGQIAVVRRL